MPAHPLPMTQYRSFNYSLSKNLYCKKSLLFIFAVWKVQSLRERFHREQECGKINYCDRILCWIFTSPSRTRQRKHTHTHTHTRTHQWNNTTRGTLVPDTEQLLQANTEQKKRGQQYSLWSQSSMITVTLLCPLLMVLRKTHCCACTSWNSTGFSASLTLNLCYDSRLLMCVWAGCLHSIPAQIPPSLSVELRGLSLFVDLKHTTIKVFPIYHQLYSFFLCLLLIASTFSSVTCSGCITLLML